MKITVQITMQSDEGHTEAVRQVACLERGPLQPETLGLSLAEARSILAGLEQSLVEQAAGGGVYRARETVPALRSAARLQRRSVDCVSYLFRQAQTSEPAAVPLPV
jgi:hypothetical protein